MAITANNFGPDDQNPSEALNEYEYLYLVGDGTQVLTAAGAGVLARVTVGVAGTLAKFYDVASGGTTDGTTEIATVDTSVTGIRFEGPVQYSKGLTVITTGASSDLTIMFRGKATTKSVRTFGV